MNAGYSQSRINSPSRQQPALGAHSRLTAKLAAGIAAGLAAISLWMITPALGQPPTTSLPLSCVSEAKSSGDLSRPAPLQLAPLQPAQAGKAQRRALLTTKLDKRLASGLLWALYLSFPICIIVAIRRHDRYSRQQMIQFVAQAAMLERIWQSSQAD